MISTDTKVFYQGTYDDAEVSRIKNLISNQREQFLETEKEQNPLKNKILTGLIILGGISIILVVTKLIKK